MGELKSRNILTFLGPVMVASSVGASPWSEEGDEPLSAAVVLLLLSTSESETRCTLRRESWSSASVWLSNGSRFDRTVPEKRTGSWFAVISHVPGLSLEYEESLPVG